MPRKMSYQALVPPDQHIAVSNLEELLTHRNLIPSWIEYWDEQKTAIKQDIKALQNIAKSLDGQTIADLRRCAKAFEHPVFSTFHALDDKHPPEYVFPDDRDSRHRQAGATTFNVCGWCQYAHPRPDSPSGAASSNCVLRPICILLTGQLVATLTDGHGLSFHGPCALLRATDADIATCLDHLDEQQRALAKKRIRYASYSRHLRVVLAEN